MQLRKFVVLLPALLVAACATPQVAPTGVPYTPSTGYARGIDMAIDSSDVAGELQGRPWLQFVARYYRDPSSRFPALSPDEARRLAATGVKIVTVWEWHSSTLSYFNYPSGYNDALSAVRQARGVGQPPGSAIYFAVDFNARDAALYWVDQYFRGVNAGLAAAGGGYRAGVYGSGAVCASVKGAGLAQYAWLSGSSSWDGTAGYSGWNIRQARAGERFGNLSFDHDANEARNDYGGFQLNYAGSPAATVVAVAAAAPAAAATVVTSAVNSIAPPSAVASTPPPAPPPFAMASAAPAPRPVAPPPPAPPMTTTAPMSEPPPAPRVMASAAPPPSPPPAMAPRQASAAAAEVAALAAEEPPASEHAAARVAAEPERPHSGLRPPREAERAEPERERATGHAEKHGRKVIALAANNRAFASPLRHVEAREPERKASTPRRAEEHGGRTQIAKAGSAHPPVDHPVHRAAERHPEKPHRERAG